MEACEALAGTGINQIYLALGVIFVIGSAFFFLPKARTLLLVLPLVFLLTISPLVAQSADPCEQLPVPPGAEESFSLVADNFSVGPDFEGYFSLLANDHQLSDDPIDWTTIDLDPETDDIQTELYLLHPDNSEVLCGEIELLSYGIVGLLIWDQCYGWDEEAEEEFTLPLPSTFTLYYTANTYEGLPAPAPAAITISIDADLPAPIVQAGDDFFNVPQGDTSVDLLANDTTSVGSLDPLTIDLDPATPGRQTSLLHTDGEGNVIELSVDGAGLLTVVSATESVPLPPYIYYTVKNTSGTISNVAQIAYGQER